MAREKALSMRTWAANSANSEDSHPSSILAHSTWRSHPRLSTSDRRRYCQRSFWSPIWSVTGDSDNASESDRQACRTR